MLKYKLVYKDGETMRYEFYPNGNGDAGVVEFKNGIGTIIKHSADDFDSFFACHAFKIDLATESGTIAWY